jgi:uncharacterized protein YxeA
MKKALGILIVILIPASVGCYFLFFHQNEKSKEINNTLDTLGNFADAQQKTADNMKTFRNLFDENGQDSKPTPPTTK